MEPTVHTNVHILADRPSVDTSPDTFPSIRFAEHVGRLVDYTTLTLTVVGDADDRRAFAADLRRAADFMEAWRESDSPPASSVYCPDCGDDLSTSVDHVCVAQIAEA